MFGFQPTTFPAPLPPPPFHIYEDSNDLGTGHPPHHRRCQSWVVPFSIFDWWPHHLKGYLTTVPLVPHSHRTCPHTQDTQATPPPVLCSTAATLVDLIAFPTSPPQPTQLGRCHLNTLTTTSTADMHAARHHLNNHHCHFNTTTTTCTRRCPLNRCHHHHQPPSTPATPLPTHLSHLPTPSRWHCHQCHHRHCPTTHTTPASTPLPLPPLPNYMHHTCINTTTLALTSHQPRATQLP
ncbi:hypothetical protein EDB89DRAFT_1990818 [Lactarius sanguifluus]|nr:hypothetical protein EDB89DRAFT_1990818 [Lactarius sanguifluus]